MRIAPRAAAVLPTRETADGLVFEYHGLDGVARHTVVQIEPAPLVAPAQCRVELTVQPGQRRDVYVAVVCSEAPQRVPLAQRFDEALNQATTAMDRVRSRLAGVRTSSDLFDEWLERSRTDIAMMVTQTRHGPYPYAGHPVVQRDVRPRGHDHRALRAVGGSVTGARRAAGARRHAGHADRPGRRCAARQDPPRGPRRRDGGARRDPVQGLLRQRGRDAALRAARRPVLPADRRHRHHQAAVAAHRSGAGLDGS